MKISFQKLFLAILFFLISSTPAFGAIEATYAGFADSPLWFDREPFFSGEEVRIYATLANSSFADFNAKVEFFDGEMTLGSTTIALERDGGFQVVWADWVPEEGLHIISVKITEATLTSPGGEPEEALYESEPIYTLERFVDTDTDGDGIGNLEDDDDDNDGIPDSEDSDPLVENIKEEPPPIMGGGPIWGRSQALSVLKEIASSTSPRIIAGIENAIDVIEGFRTSQSENIKEEIKDVKQKIREDQAGLEDTPEAENEDGRKKKNSPFNQLQLLALTTAGYTLDNKIAFYIAGMFVLYIILKKIIPWMWGFVRNRRDEY